MAQELWTEKQVGKYTLHWHGSLPTIIGISKSASGPIPTQTPVEELEQGDEGLLEFQARAVAHAETLK